MHGARDRTESCEATSPFLIAFIHFVFLLSLLVFSSFTINRLVNIILFLTEEATTNVSEMCLRIPFRLENYDENEEYGTYDE